MPGSKTKYLSLKEIAEISGYTPDYIGQLIRSGKLPGKQVYSNVSWVTTEEDLRAYLERKRSGKVGTVATLAPRQFQRIRPLKLLSVAMYGAAAIVGMLLLFLLFVLAISFEHRLNERAAKQALERTHSL